MVGMMGWLMMTRMIIEGRTGDGHDFIITAAANRIFLEFCVNCGRRGFGVCGFTN